MARKASGELREDAQRNRDALVEVARAVFAEEGTDASLRDVARRAGVGIATLYRHFPNRVALLEAVLGNGFGRLEVLAEKLESEPPGAALATWMARLAANSGWCQGLPGQVLAGLSDPESELHRSAKGMEGAVERMLVRARETGEVRSDLSAKDVIAMATAAGWVAQGAGPEQSQRMLRVISDGLAGRPND